MRRGQGHTSQSRRYGGMAEPRAACLLDQSTGRETGYDHKEEMSPRLYSISPMAKLRTFDDGETKVETAEHILKRRKDDCAARAKRQD